MIEVLNYLFFVFFAAEILFKCLNVTLLPDFACYLLLLEQAYLDGDVAISVRKLKCVGHKVLDNLDEAARVSKDVLQDH